MAKHLLELGHRKVAYKPTFDGKLQKQRFKRVDGFLKKSLKRGLSQSVIVKAAAESLIGMCRTLIQKYRIGYERK